ncbi:MAG: LL-diaminopimelate aminotransferase [Deltaproteobacteria bacterium]|nr:MAG: LL-diaminopimelate aminotransferase [Deltaproteobacteria bacterium]
MTLAERIKNLPPYLFAEIDRLKAEQIKKGVDVIDLGVGDPDVATPKHIIQALQKAAEDAANHQYPSYTGMNSFREAAATWMKNRFGVSLDPVSEVVSLIGSKEGIANFPLAFVNPGDVVLVPSPGYPPYHSGALFAGGVPYHMHLKRELGFLPDLEAIPADIVARAKVMHVNYPNNPTGAIAGKDFYERVIAFAKKHNIIVCADAAYVEQYDQVKPISFLEVPGARDVGIEFHSLSKTYNMTGWRIGFACGNKDIIAGLGKVKTNIDSGIFQAVQHAGIAALTSDQGCVDEMRQIYRRRRQLLVSGLKKLGWDVASAAAAFYVWVAVPKGSDSKTFAKKVLEEAGIVITPGVGFGEGGEGYVRFALTRDENRLQEALQRLEKIKF